MWHRFLDWVDTIPEIYLVWGAVNVLMLIGWPRRKRF